MELVDGVTLAQRLRAGCIAPGAAARVGAVVAGALAAAHERGIVHRDVKPGNLLLCARSPGVRVLDFGVARRLFAEPETHFAEIVGTPAYMAPEQIRDPARVTPAADVYALGVVLFEAVAGRRPFEATEAEQMPLAHLDETPPPLDAISPDAPRGLAALCGACLEKDPPLRPTAAVLGRELERIADELGAASIKRIGRDTQVAVEAIDGTVIGA
jgi:serine/threonine-protein kinase